MLITNLNLAFRNLLRHKLYSTINVGGLALGLAAFLFILQYVSFEKSVNGFHADMPRLYRLLNEDVRQSTWPQIEPGWAPLAKERISEIEDFCRFEEGVAQGVVKRTGDAQESFRETAIGYADGNFFRFFSFPLLQGNAADLARANTVFISEATAGKYFGNKPAIGQQLELNNQFGKANYTVSGIYRMPQNSDIQFDMVFSLETLRNPANLNNNSWAALDNLGSQYIYTYFKLAPGASYKQAEARLTALRNELSQKKDAIKFRLQPFEHVHLPASFSDYYQTTGNLKYVYLLGLVAILILLIAWFNYINLNTANALKRAAEVGVRKVIGATRSNLVWQFVTESMVVNALGLLMALAMVYLLQPYFNQTTGKPLSLKYIINTPFALSGLAMLVLAALLSSAVAAWRLSGFIPVYTLKGNLAKSTSGLTVRRVLVVVQFAISIALMTSTVLIYQQLRYMQNKNLGVKTDQVLVIRGPQVGADSTLKTRNTFFENALAQQAAVKQFCMSGSIPGNWYNFATEGFTQPGSRAGDELKNYSFAIVDHRYLNTYQIPLAGGRTFTGAEARVAWNDNSRIMINETAMRSLGFTSVEQALQTPVQWDERSLQVIGVVKDYHHSGLQRSIDPILFYPQVNNGYYSLRLQTNNLQQSIGQLEKLYQTAFPGNPFEYFFADENFKRQYAAEVQYSLLFGIAAAWAILIACLGLFGLTTFSVQQRTREVGIRKVLGASALSITRLIATDFLKLIAVAALVAFPVSWYSIHQWLGNFAYRISISPWVFIAVSLATLLLALATIGTKAVKAALANPVKSIRTE